MSERITEKELIKKFIEHDLINTNKSPEEICKKTVHDSAKAIIDLSAIYNNIKTIQKNIGDDLIGIVKADAYGHGLIPTAVTMLATGIKYLATAQLSEAVELRKNGISKDKAHIMCWIYDEHSDLEDAIENDIEIAVHNLNDLNKIVDASKKLGKTADVHIAFDTGFSREGFMYDSFKDDVKYIKCAIDEGYINAVSTFTHFIFESPEHSEGTDKQVRLYKKFRDILETNDIDTQFDHLANTAAYINNPELTTHKSRIGLAVYGLSIEEVKSHQELGLTPAMKVSTSLIRTKNIKAGSGVSYDHKFITDRDTVIGVVPIGYADGILRHGENFSVKVRHYGCCTVGKSDASVNAEPGECATDKSYTERVVPAVGSICMDQFMIDLGPNAEEIAGDEVIIFDDVYPTADDFAKSRETISYEVLLSCGKNLNRYYTNFEFLFE